MQNILPLRGSADAARSRYKTILLAQRQDLARYPTR